MRGHRLAAAWAAALAVAWLGGCTTPPLDAEPDPEPALPAAAPPLGWNEFVLPGKRRTRYLAAQEDGRPVVRAEAQASASMLRRPLQLDSAQVSRVEFSWRVDELIADADLAVAERSDSPVRVLFALTAIARSSRCATAPCSSWPRRSPANRRPTPR